MPASASTACFATRCRASGTIFIPLNTVELGAPRAAVDPATDETELEDAKLLLLELKLALLLDTEDDEAKDDRDDAELIEDRVDMAELLIDVAELKDAMLDDELEETAELVCRLDCIRDELAMEDALAELEPPDPPQAESNKLNENKLIR